MPNPDLTEIVFVIDRSSSMSSMKQEYIDGFNSFLNEQKQLPGEAKVTLILFNQNIETVYNGVDIQEVPELNDQTYVPSGMTALIDAMGTAIDQVGSRLAETPEEERAGQIVVVILTDGEENSSHTYGNRANKSRINQMVQHQQDTYSWGFVFLAANQDAVLSAQSFSMPQHTALSYNDASPQSVGASYLAVSRSVGMMRSSGHTSDLNTVGENYRDIIMSEQAPPEDPDNQNTDS